MFTFGSVYAGIGGIDLGLERAGMTCSWQVEIDDYASQVLAYQWPDVARFRDVRDTGAHNLAPVDLIAGGFMCTDISDAGPRTGLDGERSGLTWREFARLIRELRPRYVLIENVAALLGRGMAVVLGELAKLGYDAEWSVVSACALGAPHTRERLFIVAYTPSERQRRRLAEDGRASAEGRETAIRAQDNGHAARPRAVSTPWAAEPDVGRVAYGVPHRVDKLRGLGNAVVPEIAELIGRAIMAYERAA